MTKEVDVTESAGISREFGISKDTLYVKTGGTKALGRKFQLQKPTLADRASGMVTLKGLESGKEYMYDKEDFKKNFEKVSDMSEELQRQDSEPFRIGQIKGHEPSEDDENELSPVIIDLGAHRAGNLDESFIAMFGNAIKILLRRMFGGGIGSNVKIRGSRGDIDRFANTLSGEHKYLEAMSEFGLDDPKTYRHKATLDKSIAEFERSTKIKWPFK